MKRLSIVFTCDSEPIGLYEIERRLRTAGFKRPQAGSIMDAEQSDELAEAYEQGKQAVFDAMNHFDELAIVEHAPTPTERTADNPWTGDIRPHAATTTPNSGSAANHTNRRPRSPYAGHARSSATIEEKVKESQQTVENKPFPANPPRRERLRESKSPHLSAEARIVQQASIAPAKGRG